MIARMTSSLLGASLAVFISLPAAAEQPEEKMAIDMGPGKVEEGFFPGGMENYVEECRAKYVDIDKRIEAADAREGSYYPVPGYPYLRSSRLLAVMTDDLDSPAKYENWVYQLRDNDGFSREIELINMGMPGQERYQLLGDLRTCAVWLSSFELDDPRGIKKLFSAVQVPDERGSALIRDGVLPGKKSWPGKVPAVDANTQKLLLPEAASAETAQEVVAKWRDLLRDDLGRVGMTPTEQQALAELYAPSFLINKSKDSSDHPGALRWKGSKLVVSDGQPVVYFHPSFARIDFETHLQFNYIAFFSENGKPGEAVDSVVWRVTLDSDGKPMVFDSIHGAGGDHQWFPAQEMGLRESTNELSTPKVQAGNFDAERLAVQLHGQPYHVGQVLDADKLEGHVLENYSLRRYEELFLLPENGEFVYEPGDRGRSVFDGEGVMRGVAGARDKRIRQLGFHDLGSNADLHFDDPALIERLFRVKKLLSRRD